MAASIVSALFLGLYELFTKHAVRENAVLPVLFLSNLFSATIWLLMLGVQYFLPGVMPSIFQVESLAPFQHGLLALKSFIVACAWVCTYFAVKHLPVSIASPIRAMSPVLTLIGALLALAERPTSVELLGIATTIISFIGLSAAGRNEGIHFHRDRWVFWLVLGTIFNGCSALYDKFLLGRFGFAASTVQAWFAIYLTMIFLPLVTGWKLRWWTRNEFHWRWSIPLLSLALLIADFIYFNALRDKSALVSIVASLRRGSTLVAFLGGLWLFKEHASFQKTFAVLGVLLGILLTLLG
jgi:drug/metabolite transporter (DMT)-like permease